MTTEALLETYAVDQAHARQVADLALTLFDAVAPIYDLPRRTRRLLEIGALLHNVGMTTDPPQHHIVGRDIVLNAEFADLDADERAVVACLVAFHRKKVRPSLEPAYLSLGRKQQHQALSLAALLRVADGLDYAGSQSTRIVAVTGDRETLTLQLAGPHAAEDGERAQEKADLWQKVFGTRIVVEPGAAPAEGDGHVPEAALPPTGSPGEIAPIIAPQTSLAAMGRLLLRRHFRRMLAEERAVRADKGSEAIHQMRVASRRLRATLLVVGAVAPQRRARALGKTVKQAAQAAGAVRDCDVFLEQIDRYSQGLEADAAHPLAPLVAALERDRAAARARLLAWLDTERYAAFKRDFATFMTSGDGWDDAVRVRDAAGSIIWQRYEALRAHEVGLDFANLDREHSEHLHEMRIAGKRLRYVLEVFAEPLGPQAGAALDTLVALQDYLGALQDIAVAVDYVAALDCEAAARPGLDAYVASREAERDQLLAGLPERWAQVSGADYRRSLMELIVSL